MKSKSESKISLQRKVSYISPEADVFIQGSSGEKTGVKSLKKSQGYVSN